MTALVSQNPSALSIFTFDGYNFRTAVVDDTIWFIASEVAKALEYTRVNHALEHCKYATASLRDHRCHRHVNQINNLHPSTKWIPQSDLHRIVFKSTKPVAERFLDYLAEVIIPNLLSKGYHDEIGIVANLQEENLLLKHRINYLSDEKIHTSTYIGDKLGMSNQKFLSLTRDIGLTIKDRRSYGNAWRLTKSGGIYGKYSGAYIKWSERVLIPSYKHLGMDETFFTEAIPYIESRQTSLTA